MINTLNTDEDCHPMLLINIYNTKDAALINDLAEVLQSQSRRHKHFKIAIVGAFNLHHPHRQDGGCHDSEAEDLMDLMATYGLTLILPPGTIILIRHKTTIDLACGNAQMERSVLKCKVAR